MATLAPNNAADDVLELEKVAVRGCRNLLGVLIKANMMALY